MSATSEVISLRFNQNFGKLYFNFFSQSIKKCKYCIFLLGCFVCGMNDGIRIFNTEPLVEKLYLSIYKFWKNEILNLKV